MPKAYSADMRERMIAEVEGEASPTPTRSSTQGFAASAHDRFWQSGEGLWNVMSEAGDS